MAENFAHMQKVRVLLHGNITDTDNGSMGTPNTALNDHKCTKKFSTPPKKKQQQKNQQQKTDDEVILPAPQNLFKLIFMNSKDNKLNMKPNTLH